MTKKETKPLAPCVSVLGTGSDVGKSIVAAAFCRMIANRGYRVAPYKAQNMSNNSFVTVLGGEMGRAQVVQAEASRIIPHTDMNPILLKPSTNTGAQVVLNGHVMGHREAYAYFSDTSALYEKAKKALVRLRNEYDVIVMEGAGSCAEMNLKDRDFVNFRSATDANAPVILVGDIDRGGIFAQLIGTWQLLPEGERARIKGFLINRFRGDARLFDDGIKYIEEKTVVPILGLIPYFYHIEIDSEDGLPLDVLLNPKEKLDDNKINMAVIRLAHISNFTDFAPFSRDAKIRLHYLSKPKDLSKYDIVFLPGSKNTRADMMWMKDTGWDQEIIAYANNGGKVTGICGGYQLLGKKISDPRGVEGLPGECEGLGLLPVETELQKEKTLSQTTAAWLKGSHVVSGYEIHMGITRKTGASAKSALTVISRNGEAVSDETDGMITDDHRIWGTYIHGIFDAPEPRHRFLNALRPFYTPDTDTDRLAYRDEQYDLLAKHFEEHMNMDLFWPIIGLSPEK